MDVQRDKLAKDATKYKSQADKKEGEVVKAHNEISAKETAIKQKEDQIFSLKNDLDMDVVTSHKVLDELGNQMFIMKDTLTKSGMSEQVAEQFITTYNLMVKSGMGALAKGYDKY